MSALQEGATRYREFRESVFAPAESRLSESAPTGLGNVLPELEVQARWYAGEFGRDFVTTDGQTARVIQFGHWNHGAGPDFTECAVEIDGEIRGGAIEVDQEAHFWETHGHGANPNFDETILHIFLRDYEAGGRFFTRTSQHRSVPQVALAEELTEGDTRSVWGTLPEAKRGRCATPLANLSPERLQSLLDAAAQYRLERKARRHRRIAEIHSDSQALFQGIAEALGYRHNKLTMAVLSQRLQIQALTKAPALDREAMIYGAAGFLDHTHYEAGDLDAKTYLKELWDAWWRLRGHVEPDETRRLDWVLSGTRPTNHPQRRLGALTALANQWPTFRALLPRPDAAITGDWTKAVTQFLGRLSHDYWDHHYTLRSKPSDKALALLGRDRIHDMLGNIFYPAIASDHPDEWERYAALPGSLINEKLRRAAIRLFGEKDSPTAKRALKRFAHQQALLQIYTDFCLEDLSECGDCPFPEQLTQWTVTKS